MANVVLTAEAEAEYEAALAWYRGRSMRAALRLERSIAEAIAFIASFPLACPLRDARHRQRNVRRFPYGLVYRVEDDGNVIVVAVAHDRQLPGFWLGRA